MPRWDIFCRVIDNYGDIGVCWRLARQLAAEYGIAPWLWVDDWASFAHLCPQLDLALDEQDIAGVHVRRWDDHPVVTEIGAVVIEAFACELPVAVLAAMRARPVAPVWINLEYLSAENWVEGCHQRLSPQPGGLKKYFFFPGFTDCTGGLLSERAMRTARAAWRDEDARRWLGRFGADGQGALRVSFFAYENVAVAALFDSWVSSDRPIVCYLPAGSISPRLAGWAGRQLAVGDGFERGALKLQLLPWLEQDEYDRMLWSCDVNFVRGEDSFVRAQWAAKPLIWQIYRQEEGAHLAKLDAFLGHFGAAVSANVLMQAWNREAQTDIAGAWRVYAADLSAHRQHAQQWPARLELLGNLAGNLVSFVTTLVR